MLQLIDVGLIWKVNWKDSYFNFKTKNAVPFVRKISSLLENDLDYPHKNQVFIFQK